MGGVTRTDPLGIHVPPLPLHLRSIRTFLGAVARHFGCSDESIEDLRLAVTETCTQALEEGIAPDGIDVRAAWEGERLLVELEPAPTFRETHAGDREDVLEPISGERRLALVTAMFPDLELHTEAPRVLRVWVPGEGPGA